MKIEIGCGTTKTEGFVGIDRFPLPGVDIVADINLGLPIEDNQVSLLLASHSLEHFEDLPSVMKEIYRVCKHGAQICVIAPYSETLLDKTNPYHLQKFNEHTFRFFAKSNITGMDTKDYFFPNSPLYGLLHSDNSDLNVNFVLSNIEYFYFEGYDLLSAEEQRYYRKHNDVCDQVVYHLIVLKKDVSEEEISQLITETTFYYPNYVLERKGKLKNKLESLDITALNDIKKSLLSPVAREFIESQEAKHKALEETTRQQILMLHNQLNAYTESQETKLQNQSRLLSLYVKKSNKFKTFYNFIKMNDNLIYHMNVNQFNERLVLNLDHDMGDYKVKFSHFIPTFPNYNEYRITNNKHAHELELYCELFSTTLLTYEIVQHDTIIHNAQIALSQAGTFKLVFPEIEGDFYLRIQVADETQFMCVAEWYASNLLKRVVTKDQLCYIVNGK